MAFQKGNVRKRKKVDPFAGDKINTIDYKDVALLKNISLKEEKFFQEE